MTILKTLKRVIPVCYLQNDNLLCYKFGVFYAYNTSDNSKEIICRFRSLKETMASRVSCFSRIFRFGVRCSILLENDIVLVTISKRIYEINLSLRSISNGYGTSLGSRPLKFSEIKGVDGFEKMIVFGEYLNNPAKRPVSIYKRMAEDRWEIIFTFPEGEIEHIHNIIPDALNRCVWIMTGDFDNSAAIWMAKDNFKTVHPVLRGNQKYRGCVGFPTDKGLLYATDSPYFENSIRILSLNLFNKWESNKLLDINGSSIYGTQLKNMYIFSTAVEGDGREPDIIARFFGGKRGVAIKDNYCYVYAGTIENGFSTIYKAKKDFLPFIMFQFGAIKFPDGLSDGNILPIYHIATTKYDLSMNLFSI